MGFHEWAALILSIVVAVLGLIALLPGKDTKGLWVARGIVAFFAMVMVDLVVDSSNVTDPLVVMDQIYLASVAAICLGLIAVVDCTRVFNRVMSPTPQTHGALPKIS
jgi:hypothetical protein